MSAEIHELPQKKEKRFKKAGENMLLNQKSGIYYAKKDFTRYGIPELFQSTGYGLKEKQKAKAKVLELIKEHMERYLGPNAGNAVSRKKGIKASQVIDEVLAHYTPGLRKGTQINQNIYLPELKEEWGHWDINRITSDSWKEWLPRFQEKKRRKALELQKRMKWKNPQFRTTFDDYAKNMNVVMTFGYEKKYISHRVSMPYLDKKKGQVGRVFTDEEITALWNALGSNTQDQYLMCYEGMMRKREAICLPKSRFNPETGVITLLPEDVKTGSQTGRGRTFKVSKELHMRLLKRLETTKGSPFFFPSPKDPSKPVWDNKKAWTRAKDAVGILGRARWHDLRHTAISKAILEEKAKIEEVSLYCGTSVRTLERVYLHNDAEKTAGIAEVVKVKKKEE